MHSAPSGTSGALVSLFGSARAASHLSAAFTPDARSATESDRSTSFLAHLQATYVLKNRLVPCNIEAAFLAKQPAASSWRKAGPGNAWSAQGKRSMDVCPELYWGTCIAQLKLQPLASLAPHRIACIAPINVLCMAYGCRFRLFGRPVWAAEDMHLVMHGPVHQHFLTKLQCITYFCSDK
eukprot:1159295-Pelagomonas_calceolata.AAC.12